MTPGSITGPTAPQPRPLTWSGTEYAVRTIHLTLCHLQRIPIMINLEYKPDAAKSCERMAAWWQGSIVDRPAILLTAPKPNAKLLPQKQHASTRARWMDIDYQVECADIGAANTYWAGDGLPTFMPNLGPEILTACFGAELEFTESTSWSKPILHDWADIPQLKIDHENEYLQCILEMTRRALEAGK